MMKLALIVFLLIVSLSFFVITKTSLLIVIVIFTIIWLSFMYFFTIFNYSLFSVIFRNVSTLTATK